MKKIKNMSIRDEKSMQLKLYDLFSLIIICLNYNPECNFKGVLKLDQLEVMGTLKQIIELESMLDIPSMS